MTAAAVAIVAGEEVATTVKKNLLTAGTYGYEKARWDV
jgi:hypothetical protein